MSVLQNTISKIKSASPKFIHNLTILNLMNISTLNYIITANLYFSNVNVSIVFLFPSKEKERNLKMKNDIQLVH